MPAPKSLAAFFLLLGSCAGCAGLQDAEYCVANWSRAEYNWLTSTTVSQRWEYSSDYEKGWKDGYKAALNGQACNLPAVPPPCYWSYKYQSCEGREAIADWYRGWQVGAAQAARCGTPSFHEIPVGPCAPDVLGSSCKSCAVPSRCNPPCSQTHDCQPFPAGTTHFGPQVPHLEPTSPSDVPAGLIGPTGATSSGVAYEVQPASAETRWMR